MNLTRTSRPIVELDLHRAHRHHPRRPVPGARYPAHHADQSRRVLERQRVRRLQPPVGVPEEHPEPQRRWLVRPHADPNQRRHQPQQHVCDPFRRRAGQQHQPEPRLHRDVPRHLQRLAQHADSSSTGDYYSHGAGLRLNAVVGRGVVLRQELNHNLQSGVPSAYGQDIVLWSTRSGRSS